MKNKADTLESDSSFPRIETGRLILAKLQWSDIPKIVEYAGNKNVTATTLNIPHPYGEDDAIFWINAANRGFQNKNLYTFGIRLQSTNEFIGGISVKILKEFNRASLGYWVAEPFWNKGYTTEATGAIIEFGFKTLHLNKIYATHLIENPASGKVMIKNGMIKEGELKDHYKKGSNYKSVFQYRLTREEYESS